MSERQPTYTNFCFVLYPDDDRHMITLAYLKRFNSMYHIAYIYHDRDVWTIEDQLENPNHVAGEHKKTHIHVLLNMRCNSTISGVQKFLHLDHVEHCENVGYYLTYMLHLTPDCVEACKPVYQRDEMVCDKKFAVLLDKQNLYFIQLEEVASMIRASPDVKLIDVIRFINSKADTTYSDMYDKYQYVIAQMLTERDRDIDRDFRKTHPMQIIAYQNANDYLNDKSRKALKESYERVKPKNLEMSD